MLVHQFLEILIEFQRLNFVQGFAADTKKPGKSLHDQAKIARALRRLKRHGECDLRFFELALFKSQLPQLEPRL